MRRTVMLWPRSPLSPAAAHAGLVLLVFLALFLYVVGRPMMLRIMASMHPKDSYAVGWCLLVTMLLALCSFLLSLTGPRCSASWPFWTKSTVTSTLVSCLAGFAGDSALRAVFLYLSSGPDGRHHGRHAPEGMLRVAVQKTADFPKLQFRSLISCRGAEARPLGPCGHTDFPAAGQGDRCPYCTGRTVHPVVAQRLFLTVQTVVGPRDFPVA